VKTRQDAQEVGVWLKRRPAHGTKMRRRDRVSEEGSEEVDEKMWCCEAQERGSWWGGV